MGNLTKLVPKMWKFSRFRNESLTLRSIQLILPFMKRDIYQQLIAWKHSELRKPLILRGARQVGKTYILLEFAKKEYENYIYLNFDDDPTLDALFSQRFDKEKIITGLSIYGGGVKVLPGSTLIIFDEIQASNNALNSLKYFNERAKEYHIAAAGSLLGIKLGGQRSFPVGQVTFLDLYPLTFLEFLNADWLSSMPAHLRKRRYGYLGQFIPPSQGYASPSIDSPAAVFYAYAPRAPTGGGRIDGQLARMN